MVTTRLPPAECPNCGTKVTAASTVEHDDRSEPSEGDLAICLYCGELNAYTREFKLRPLTRAELSDLMTDREVSNQILAMRRAVHAANPKGQVRAGGVDEGAD